MRLLSVQLDACSLNFNANQRAFILVFHVTPCNNLRKQSNRFLIYVGNKINVD